MVSFDQFKEIDLRIARISNVEEIEGKDKLYKLSIDLGSEQRTIVAGIKPFYKKDDLVGKNIVVVANLEPATIAGIKSEAMLLAARNSENGYSLVTIDSSNVEPGTKVE